VSWLDEMEEQVAILAVPALRPDIITQQPGRNEVGIVDLEYH
jgi:hypothetical protein